MGLALRGRHAELIAHGQAASRLKAQTMSPMLQNHPKKCAGKVLFLPSQPPSAQKNKAPDAVAIKVCCFSAAC
jgi:hypothetical protein